MHDVMSGHHGRRRPSRRRGTLRPRRRRRSGALAWMPVLLVVCVVVGAAAFALTRCGGQSATSTAESASQATVAEPAASSQPVQIDLVMIGDILQHSYVYKSGYQNDGTRNYDHVFSHIASELEGMDIKVVNQETPLGGSVSEFSGYPSFNGPQEMGDAEAKVGFNVVLRASNHTMDVGYDGLHSELAFWKGAHPDVHVIGAADPKDSSTSVDDVYVFEKDGFKVALLNYTYDLNGYSDPKGAVSMLDEGHVRATMKKAREEADMVVVFPHWGEEYQTKPVASQRTWEKFFIECGADVIIGGHPHVIEPVETFERASGGVGVCFWSVGNFISTQIDNENLVGGMAKVSLQKAEDGSCRVSAASFEPVITHKGIGKDMTTYMLRDYTNGLAATNAISGFTSNTGLTPAWAQSFVTSVVGKDYDKEDCKLAVDLGAGA